MADPVSITGSVLAIVTAAIQRFRERNKTLGRLQDELENLSRIFDLLKQAINTDASVLVLLQGPRDRCSQSCRDENWARMEFKSGDINEFIETVAGYKSTISVGLGIITMHTSKFSQKVLEEYNEMIKDTSYGLEEHLQRIDEKLAQLTIENRDNPGGSIDLKDKRAVTEQCLLLRQDTHQDASDDAAVQQRFEAQRLTRQALDDNQLSFMEIIKNRQRRLEILVINGDSGDNKERLRLQEDLNISKQCLEVCQVASDAFSQKIFRVGEVVADGEGDQVVVTTLADLFDVKKAFSKGNSAQLVGSMESTDLQLLAEKRYGSRFGAVTDDRGSARPIAANPKFAHETGKNEHGFSSRAGSHERSAGRSPESSAPAPNEMRKRVLGGAKDYI
ncbi:hypothetical protein BDW62DRAFT_212059 [Aspergillus aurantiobrunneus]